MSIRRDGRRQIVNEGPHGELDISRSLDVVEKVGNQMKAQIGGKGFQIRAPKGKS